MTQVTDVVVHAITAGEASPRLHRRPDLEQFDYGMSELLNWMVHPKGGAFTRPGLEFADIVSDIDTDHLLIPFEFANNEANTYMLLFGDEYIRFLQDGAYVLESSSQPIQSITNGTTTTVGVTSHGFSAGDLIVITGVIETTELNGRTFKIGSVTTNDFTLIDLVTGTDLDSSTYGTYIFPGGDVFRVYTVTSPYTASDLEELDVKQVRDTVFLHHPQFKRRKLTRQAADSWTLELNLVSNAMTAPTISSVTGRADISGDNVPGIDVGFVVTAVDLNGNESVGSVPVIAEGILDYSVLQGWALVKWSPVADAAKYKVYRTRLENTVANSTNGATPVGFVGETRATEFLDNNIIPDFGKTPPRRYDPFENGSVLHVEVTAVGSGYPVSGTTVTITDSGSDGTGFSAYANVNDSGEVISITITNPGKDYGQASTIAIAGSGGSGATAEPILSAESGNYPRTTAISAQRQLFSGLDEKPTGIIGSQVGLFTNFDFRDAVDDSDSFEFEIDANKQDILKHLVLGRGGLLAFGSTGVWRVTGADGTLSASDQEAEIQLEQGSADVRPIPIEGNVLHVTHKENIPQLLVHNARSRYYDPQPIASFSSHLFGKDKEITSMGYAATPYKQVHAVQNGRALCLTLDFAERLVAWTPQVTQGLFKTVGTLDVENRSDTYFIVERYLNGNRVKTIERYTEREIDEVEESFCVDAGVKLANTTISIAGYLGTVDSDTRLATLYTEADAFASGDVGKIIRFNKGKYEVKTYTSAREVIVEEFRPTDDLFHTDTRSNRFTSFTMDTPVTTVSNLWHLEGIMVTVLADGRIYRDLTVSGGEITLPTEASRVVVGLGYTCTAKSLPFLVTTENTQLRRKAPIAVAFGQFNTRGLKIGGNINKLVEVKDRTVEVYGTTSELRTEAKFQSLTGSLEMESGVYFVQEEPLPATILGFATRIQIGDGDND